MASYRNNDELVQVARDMRPMLRKNSATSESDRRLARESSKALREAGFFQLTAPRRSGGLEVDVETYCVVCEELARGDSSAGWVSMITAGGAFLMGMMPDKVRDEVYGADPTAAVIGQWAPTAKSEEVDGGYLLNGKWMWASGCYDAQWTFVGFPALDRRSNEPDVRVGLVPTNELKIEDTWYVAGMSGTGSNTYAGTNIFVPAYRTLSMKDITEGNSFSDHRDEALYRSSIVTALPLGICATVCGMAEAAFDLTLEALGRGKPIVGSIYKDARESPSYQLNLADARGNIDSARLHIMRAAADIDLGVREGRKLTELARARVRLDESIALKRLREALDLLLNIGGAGSFMLSNPLQKLWRDVGTASRHAYTNGDLGREIYGRAILNRDQVSTSF